MELSKPHRTSKSLFKLLRAESREIAVILTYGVGVGLLSLAVPVGIQAIVNTTTFGTYSQPVVSLIFAVLVGLTLAAVCRTLQVYVVEQLQKRFFCYTALELAARLPRVQTDRLSGARFPELVNRFFDVLVVQKSTATLLLEGFTIVLQTIIGLVLLGFYHPALLAFDIVLVVFMVLILFGLGRGAVKTSIEESAQKYRVASWLEEIATKSLSFKNKDARMLALLKADELVLEYLNARQSHFKILMRQVVGSLGLQALANAILLGLGTYLVTNNQLTLGQLVAAEIVVTNVLSSVAKFQKHLEAFYDLAAGLDKIEGLMNLPLEKMSSYQKIESTLPAKISFKDASFLYPNSKFSLKPLSLELPSGARVALVGSNGSGKSTVVDLLYGLKLCTSGTILIDDVDFRDCGPEELRRHIAIVRGIEVIAGSILENVSFGRHSVTHESAKEALNKVGLLNEILTLSDGIHTYLGENGSPLSIAHAQRLMIARAIASNPRLLIIDESLDALDAESLVPLMEVLFAPSASWTLILSTTDPNIIKRCDHVIYLDTKLQGRAA